MFVLCRAASFSEALTEDVTDTSPASRHFER